EADKAIAEYKEAWAKLTTSAGAPECVWTGRRIASLLWRDDIDTARRYIDLYDRFNCSSEHLKLVFRCVIEQGPIDPKAADRLASRVHNCWITPEEATTASSQATVGATTKAGTIPN
ncbi:MAG: beta-1-3, beta-1-6-glucan biosynthesis protein, partial [Methyloceanibacter sp.]